METTIDTRGLKCPLPVLRLEKALATNTPDETIILLADDPVASIDIPIFCQKNMLACTVSKSAEVFTFTIRRAQTN